jgi:hypothetical protein
LPPSVVYHRTTWKNCNKPTSLDLSTAPSQRTVEIDRMDMLQTLEQTNLYFEESVPNFLHCLQFSDVPYTKEVLYPPGRTRPDSPILDHSKWLWCKRKGHTYTSNRVCNKKGSIQQHKPILNMGPLVAFFFLYYTIRQILPIPTLWVLCHSSQAPYQIDVLHLIINV